MAGARYDPVKVLVDLLIDADALYYTRPCRMERQVYVHLQLLAVFTKRPLQRLRQALDRVAIDCGCAFVNSNLEDCFAVFSVGPRAREFELKLGDMLLDLPEYRPVTSAAITPVGTFEMPLIIPTRLDLPRYSQMTNPMVYRSPVNVMARLGEYLWEKKTDLPANFRREAEAVLQRDYRPLILRAEQLILRAIEFHREEEVQMPTFLMRLSPEAPECGD